MATAKPLYRSTERRLKTGRETGHMKVLKGRDQEPGKKRNYATQRALVEIHTDAAQEMCDKTYHNLINRYIGIDKQLNHLQRRGAISLVEDYWRVQLGLLFNAARSERQRLERLIAAAETEDAQIGITIGDAANEVPLKFEFLITTAQAALLLRTIVEIDRLFQTLDRAELAPAMPPIVRGDVANGIRKYYIRGLARIRTSLQKMSQRLYGEISDLNEVVRELRREYLPAQLIRQLRASTPSDGQDAQPSEQDTNEGSPDASTQSVEAVRDRLKKFTERMKEQGAA